MFSYNFDPLISYNFDPLIRNNDCLPACWQTASSITHCLRMAVLSVCVCVHDLGLWGVSNNQTGTCMSAHILTASDEAAPGMPPLRGSEGWGKGGREDIGGPQMT